MQLIEETKEELAKKELELTECKGKINDQADKITKSEENMDSLTSEIITGYSLKC